MFCTAYVQPNGGGTYTVLNQLTLVWVPPIEVGLCHTLNCTKLAHWDIFKDHWSVKFLFITLPWRNSLISLRWRSTVEWAICSESVLTTFITSAGTGKMPGRSLPWNNSTSAIRYEFSWVTFLFPSRSISCHLILTSFSQFSIWWQKEWMPFSSRCHIHSSSYFPLTWKLILLDNNHKCCSNKNLDNSISSTYLQKDNIWKLTTLIGLWNQSQPY